MPILRGFNLNEFVNHDGGVEAVKTIIVKGDNLSVSG